MNVFMTLMNVISAILSVYMILIIIRIFLTWFHSNLHSSKAVEILTQIVDPYLNLFRRITWLQAGRMDFSPIVAMMVLGLLVQMTSTIAQTGSFSLSMLIAYLIYALWSFASFILNILILMMVVRLVSLFFVKTSHSFWFTMDSILNKVMAKILGIFTSKPMPFRKALIVCGLILLVVRVGLQFAVAYLMMFLRTL
ncbi:MAG: YggT family protein [Spirochaetales bacterium]|nr:YggT family protein [Spirochaetales bacterium]